jgi:hypothetical protein
VQQRLQENSPPRPLIGRRGPPPHPGPGTRGRRSLHERRHEPRRGHRGHRVPLEVTILGLPWKVPLPEDWPTRPLRRFFDASVHRHRAGPEPDQGACCRTAQPCGQGRGCSGVAARERGASAPDRPGPLRARGPKRTESGSPRSPGRSRAGAGARCSRSRPPRCRPAIGDSSPGSGRMLSAAAHQSRQQPVLRTLNNEYHRAA